MTVQTVPFALQNASHSAAVFRQAMSAPYAYGGYIGQTELGVGAQSTPNMSVVLGPGRAKVPGTNVGSPLAGNGTSVPFTTQAMYDVLNDANLTLTVATADATNPRIDVIYIGVQDAYYSGANNQAIAGIVTGTPAATPSVPAVPANSIALAQVAVAANASSITNSNLTIVAKQATFIGVDQSTWAAGSAALPQNGTAINFPPAGQKLIRLIGYVSTGTNASGVAASQINFSTAFPNACLHISAMTITGSAQQPVINAAKVNATGFTPIWNNSPSTTVTFTFEAIGW